MLCCHRAPGAAGIKHHFLVCSPQEAAAFKAGVKVYTVSMADLIFRAALLMLIAELRRHPGGDTGEQQLSSAGSLG